MGFHKALVVLMAITQSLLRKYSGDIIPSNLSLDTGEYPQSFLSLALSQPCLTALACGWYS